MDLNLRDKVVVVTGAADIKGSIGGTIAHALVEEGVSISVLKWHRPDKEIRPLE